MSTQPRKERKALYNAPVHKRRELVSAHLDEPLLLKYNTRSTTVRKGDTVRVLRGEYAGTTGKILEVNTRTRKVTVDGVTVQKAKATQVARPLDPSNLVITRLDLTDPLRREKLGASEADAEPSASAGRGSGRGRGEADVEREEAPRKAPAKKEKKQAAPAEDEEEA